MEHSLEMMLSRMEDILEDNAFTAYLYGSVTMEDFRWGWSDIDLLCLTEREFSASQARRLAGLRQELQAAEPDNRYFRLFEGGVLPFGCYETGGEADAAYWGTSGQRVARRFEVSVFTRLVILDMGRLVHGRERRGEMRRPGYPELREGVAAHYAVIRRQALSPAANLHTAGWMLDIARCLYSLRTGGIISKTAAGKWAMEQRLFPDRRVMERILQIRREPLRYREDPAALEWLAGLEGEIRLFTDRLGQELEQEKQRPDNEVPSGRISV